MSPPKIVYVCDVKEAGGAVYLNVERTAAEVIQDDGPTVVGTYELRTTARLRKIVKIEGKT